MKIIANLSVKLNRARVVTRISYALMVLNTLVDGLVGASPWFIIVFSLFPLLLFMRTFKTESYKGLSLLCFVILMYFMVTVVYLFSPAADAFDWIALVLECVLFCSAMMFSRWKQYSLYQTTDMEAEAKQ
ncbi:MAG: DUF2069 domain-containing protein [bacterium]